jgi:hypothetical protein
MTDPTLGVDIASARNDRVSDAFGVSTRERVLRRLVAAAIAAWLFPPTSFLAVPVAYLAGLPVSFLLEWRWPGRRGRPTLVRYGLLGALMGVLVVLVFFENRLGLLPVAGVAIGGASGGLGAWVASVLPVRWVLPASVLGTALTVGSSPPSEQQPCRCSSPELPHAIRTRPTAPALSPQPPTLPYIQRAFVVATPLPAGDRSASRGMARLS